MCVWHHQSQYVKPAVSSVHPTGWPMAGLPKSYNKRDGPLTIIA